MDKFPVYSLIIMSPNPLECIDPYDEASYEEEEEVIKGEELIKHVRNTMTEK